MLSASASALLCSNLTTIPNHLGVCSLPLFTLLWSLWVASREQEPRHGPGLCRETSSWRDTPVLSRLGQASGGGLSGLSPLETLTLWFLLKAVRKGLSPNLDSHTHRHTPPTHTHTHTAPIPPPPTHCMEEKQSRDIPRLAFFTRAHQPSPASVGFGSFQWKMSPKALEPSWWFTENFTSTWAFRLQPTPKRQREEEGEIHKWIGRWETDVWSLPWQGILHLDLLSSRD